MARRYVTDEQIEALQDAVRWSYVIGVQARRLADGQDACLAAWRAAHAAKHIGDDYMPPWWVMEADKHYLLIAARHLVNALERWGDTFPDGNVDPDDIRMLRNWREHPEAAGSAARRWASLAMPVDVTLDSHEWSGDDTLLAGRLRVKPLREWAARVHDELRTVDAWSVSPPADGPLRSAL